MESPKEAKSFWLFFLFYFKSSVQNINKGSSQQADEVLNLY
jgi:hypothetical protein